MNALLEINVTLILYIKLGISTKENDTYEKAHIDMTSLNWKFRYYNHIQPFKIKQPYLGITGIRLN